MKLHIQEFQKEATGGCFGSSASAPAMKIRIEASPKEVAILKSKITLDRFSMASDPRFREEEHPFKFWLEGFLNKETEWSGGDAATLRSIQAQFTENSKRLQAMIDSVQSAEDGFGGSREIEL